MGLLSRRTAMLLLAALLLSLASVAQGFKPMFSKGSTTHREITIRAVLQKTAEVCRDMAAAEGRDFSLTIDDSLTPERVQEACLPSGKDSSILSTVMFHTSLHTMTLSNALVDQVYILSAVRHFDDETIQGGRAIITTGVAAVKRSVKQEDFIAGRRTLGATCHTLQDFYSHSNWVELGKTSPYSKLIQPDQPLDNLAGPDVPTCRNCAGDSCDDNILPELLNLGLITTGYFSLFSSVKPPGKCSHGGFFDRTSRRDPVGGINKDTMGSSHGSLHPKAADLAVKATIELLGDIRLAVGDKAFLQLVGLSQSSVLCFVIDTTGSMSDDIAEAKRVSFDIIDRKKGTSQEPSAYILVPFNDPGFGPLVTTTDAEIFKASINKLTASGGGDNPEMCLSGLQLALTAAPPSSDIFVFTDAPAKDADLKSTITALIESTKSVVTFMLTSVFARRRRRDSQGVAPRSIGPAGVELYRDLARASGGQTIEGSKSDLAAATAVIQDSSASAVVTVFQAVKKPGSPDTFTFTVDGSLQNMTAYITGASSLTFILTSPSGASQTSSETSGPLASMTTAGNLRRLSLSTGNQTGLWEVSVNSNDPYSVKVTGQSSVNFIFNLVEAFEGAHGDFSLKEGRPFAGGNISLMITVTGSDSVKVTEVTLFDSSGPTQVNGTLESLGGGTFLARFNNVPAGEYVVRLNGEESGSISRASASSFQRQASTQMKTSSISVTADVSNTSIEPGSTISIPFTVASMANGVVNESATGTFKVRSNNDRSFPSSSPSSVTVEAGSGGKANGTITVTVPSSAASGSDLTLTIEAENADASDINYAVVRFSITAKVTDVDRPVCQVVSRASCPSHSCSSSQWEFIANITDGINGTGIDSVRLRQGNGTLNVSSVSGAGGENITVASYSASCCFQSVELVAVDRVGNVGSCVGQARALTTAAPPTTAPATTVSTTSSAPSFSTTYFLWGSLLLCLLLK
ncbi:von Willebrand factor A domain-containing protein 7-like [Synchiropus splendidus]|uniref:von Willebrand factor A domain-containing protein 7-like n=1 Tax=Synchiropus splendidus TaxID=270530 RepID=UPI00237D686F|nr:von Willebrand factor A domain-containing protein 7-like [Synchiropus splendidus]